MENNLKTFLKHALKVFTDYLAVLFIFIILSYPVISIGGDNPAPAVGVASFFLFLLLFLLLYRDMFDIAVRERRPQYNINPGPVRGLLLGLTGLVPIWVIEGVIALVRIGDNEIFQIRLIQAVSVPLYWLAALVNGQPSLYPFLLLLVAGMAFLGYWAGLRDFFLMQRIYKLIGYTPKKRVRKPRPRNTGKGFWRM